MAETQRAKPSGLIRRTSGGWAVALLLVLGACQAPKPAGGDASAVPPVPGAPPATAALPSEPPINDDPNQLMGIGPGALSAILGEPELIRREAPAQIWQYRNDRCVFDVFLYDNSGRWEVTYIEARDAAAQRVEARACLNTLLRARVSRPLG